MTNLDDFFESPRSNKRKKTNPQGGGGGVDDEGKHSDHELKKVLEISFEESKLNSMTEKEQIQYAMQLSLKNVQHGQGRQANHRVAPLFHSKRVTSNPLSKVDPSSSSVVDWDRALMFSPSEGQPIQRLNRSLDLIYWPGWLLSSQEPGRGRKRLMRWMLEEFIWHRVEYQRPNGTSVRTLRYTTTFGKDDTEAPADCYEIPPEPFPEPLEKLRQKAEQVTGARFNTVIINYYADGNDSISYHSDDERFLGENSYIASLTLGCSRDFYFRRKAPADSEVPRSTHPSGSKGVGPAHTRPMEKMVLNDGDLLLMRGKTQAEWEHSVPKRANVGSRINLTFRKVLSTTGTNNFLHYSRGKGDRFRWIHGKMVLLEEKRKEPHTMNKEQADMS